MICNRCIHQEVCMYYSELLTDKCDDYFNLDDEFEKIKSEFEELKEKTKGDNMSHLNIMRKAVSDELRRNNKPDLSYDDYVFISKCLDTLSDIWFVMDDINPEHFKDNCEKLFTILEKETGYELEDV